jgi:predicted alpha/beta-hydrolase family hydrolase
MTTSRLELETATGPAVVQLDQPRSPAALIVLTHGSGGGVETADLLAVRSAALSAGIALALVTQPYRVAGRRTPPAAGRQDAAWLEIVAALRSGRTRGRLPLMTGGRSNGARVACRTAQQTGASAVVALAFPLHPPGKPEKSRLDELCGAQVTTLVVQGDRDAFGMPPPGRERTVVVVPGADHRLTTDLDAVAAAVVEFATGVAAGAGTLSARRLQRTGRR